MRNLILYHIATKINRYYKEKFTSLCERQKTSKSAFLRQMIVSAVEQDEANKEAERAPSADVAPGDKG